MHLGTIEGNLGIYHPLKEGLKHLPGHFVATKSESWYLSSIKRRIETGIFAADSSGRFVLGIYHPLKEGLKPPIKPREAANI